MLTLVALAENTLPTVMLNCSSVRLNAPVWRLNTPCRPLSPGLVGVTLAVTVELPGRTVAVPAVMVKVGAAGFPFTIAPEMWPVALSMVILARVTEGVATASTLGMLNPELIVREAELMVTLPASKLMAKEPVAEKKVVVPEPSVKSSGLAPVKAPAPRLILTVPPDWLKANPPLMLM